MASVFDHWLGAFCARTESNVAKHSKANNSKARTAALTVWCWTMPPLWCAHPNGDLPLISLRMRLGSCRLSHLNVTAALGRSRLTGNLGWKFVCQSQLWTKKRMDWKLYTVHVISRVPSLILHWKSRQERNCRASQPLFWPRLADDLRRQRHGLNECLKQESSGANTVHDFVKLHSSCTEGAYWWMYYMLFVCLFVFRWIGITFP